MIHVIQFDSGIYPRRGIIIERSGRITYVVRLALHVPMREKYYYCLISWKFPHYWKLLNEIKRLGAIELAFGVCRSPETAL